MYATEASPELKSAVNMMLTNVDNNNVYLIKRPY